MKRLAILLISWTLAACGGGNSITSTPTADATTPASAHRQRAVLLAPTGRRAQAA